MTLEQWKNWTDIVNNIIVSLAALAGGLWAFTGYWRERMNESALDIGIDYDTTPFGTDYIVTLDVVLTNRERPNSKPRPRSASTDLRITTTSKS